MMIDDEKTLNFKRITEAINYLQTNFKTHPNLDEIASNINLSPFHFHRIFTEWAGTSPHNFLQYIGITYAKKLLKQNKQTLAETTHQMGLSSTSRLHDLFIKIEGMTPAEYKNGGKNLVINYSFSNTPFGHVLVASTTVGICYIAFIENEQLATTALQLYLPQATLIKRNDALQQNALSIFSKDWTQINLIKLHLKGTDFQLKVWEALLNIPLGQLVSYGNIANKINEPKASRAVGTAIGNNPVAFLIPCHRVIQSTGLFGQYMWGATRKAAIIGWEAVEINT